MENKIIIGDHKNCIDAMWISKDVCICTNKRHSRWNKLFLFIFLGWRIEHREPHEELKGLDK